MMLANMPVYGINQGTQPIVGFNFGAKRFDRVKQALLTGILYASTLDGPRLCRRDAHSGAGDGTVHQRRRAADRSELIDLGVHAMRLCFLMSPLVGFQVVSASYFQATGKPREATLLMLSRQVFLLIPLVWILPSSSQLDGVWMALPISDGVSSLLTGACLFFELRHLDSRHQETTARQTVGRRRRWPRRDLAVPEDAGVMCIGKKHARRTSGPSSVRIGARTARRHRPSSESAESRLGPRADIPRQTAVIGAIFGMPQGETAQDALGQHVDLRLGAGRRVGPAKLRALGGVKVLVVTALQNCFKYVPHRNKTPNN